jgi:acetoin utilization deacetylase AcuC-like enzyme
VDEVGKKKGQGFTVNVPLTTKGLGNWDYHACMERMVLPIMTEFDPDLVRTDRTNK